MAKRKQVDRAYLVVRELVLNAFDAQLSLSAFKKKSIDIEL